MKYKDLKVGQHLWVISNNKLLMVYKPEEDYGYEVCGPWECGISDEDCEIVELIDKPKGYENLDYYYDN